MYSQIKSGTLYGLASEQVVVETDLSPGLPAFNVVGLPDATVRESKERIRAAIVNSGFKFPAKRITINLAPAGTKKEGTHFDLPIAVGVMTSVGTIRKNRTAEYAFWVSCLWMAASTGSTGRCRWSSGCGIRASENHPARTECGGGFRHQRCFDLSGTASQRNRRIFRW